MIFERLRKLAIKKKIKAIPMSDFGDMASQTFRSKWFKKIRLKKSVQNYAQPLT